MRIGSETAMANLKERLIREVEKIPGVTDEKSPVAGGSALHFNGKEFAHFHHANELDLKLTKKLIKHEKLSHYNDSKVHPKRSPNSPWIELRYGNAAEMKEVVRLVELALDTM